jgi:DNA repair protein RecO
MLGLMGLAPSLECCVSCGRTDLEPPVIFDAPHGGVVCTSCAARGVQVSAEVHAALVAFSSEALAAAAAMELPRETTREVRQLMLSLVRHHLGYAPRSLDFLVQLVAQSHGDPRQPR